MSEFLVVAERVLSHTRLPMSAREIYEYGHAQGWFSDKIGGRTPHQTMKAKISVHIRRYGSGSHFVRTAPGRFFLRRLLDHKPPAYHPSPVKPLPIPNEDLVFDFLKNPRGPTRLQTASVGSKPAIYEALPLHPPLPPEEVLVIPSDWLDANGRFQGITTKWRHFLRAIVASKRHSYLPRADAEQTQQFKQVVAYILVTHGGKLLAFKRGTYTSTDALLRGSHCVGFGGHVTQADMTLFDRTGLGLIESATRELAEELQLPEEDRKRLIAGLGLEIIGALNDDSSDVGRRHIAFVLRYEVTDAKEWHFPKRGEKAVTQLRWLDPLAAGLSLRDFEYWSQLCLRIFYAPAVRGLPSFRVQRKKSLVPPNILCVVGPVGSGKTEAARILTREYGYEEINSGRVIARLLDIPPIPRTPREEFQLKAHKFIIRRRAPAKLAKEIWSDVQKLSAPRVLIDGIRHGSTLEELRQLAGNTRIGLIYVYTPPDIAYEFYRQRVAKMKKLTIHEFLRLRDSPVEGKVQEMLPVADAVLYNWLGRFSYRQTIHRLMKEIGIIKLRTQ